MNDHDMAIETVVKSGFGLIGAFTSWNLATINQLASLVVAVLTAAYMAVQIYKSLRK
jgi:hypothetical protein